MTGLGTPSGGEGQAAWVTSVNVGAIRQIVHRGRTTTSGIWKESVADRRAVLVDHIEGDHQADLEFHGGPSKAVYLYAAEDYGWWEDTLGTKLGPGSFGENLTVSGIELSRLGIGARLQVGTALLEAVQPRFPCWKLGVRMGNPKFPQRFLKAARAGVYCSVAQEGSVAAGDPVRLISQPDHPVTIGLIAQLNHRDRPMAQLLMEAVSAGLTDEDWLAIMPGVTPPSPVSPRQGEPSPALRQEPGGAE